MAYNLPGFAVISTFIKVIASRLIFSARKIVKMGGGGKLGVCYLETKCIHCIASAWQIQSLHDYCCQCYENINVGIGAKWLRYNTDKFEFFKVELHTNVSDFFSRRWYSRSEDWEGWEWIGAVWNWFYWVYQDRAEVFTDSVPSRLHTTCKFNKFSYTLHTLCAANLNSGYSKYAKAARVHDFCTVALQTPYARMSAGVGCIHTHRIKTFTFRSGWFDFVGNIWKLFKT